MNRYFLAMQFIEKLTVRIPLSSWRQLWRFMCVGAFTTGLHMIVAVATLHILNVGTLEANVAAFTAATVFSYSLNSYWSFEKEIALASFVKFIFVGIINLTLIILISVVNDIGGWRSEIGILLAAVLVPPMSFVLHKIWTFR